MIFEQVSSQIKSQADLEHVFLHFANKGKKLDDAVQAVRSGGAGEGKEGWTQIMTVKGGNLQERGEFPDCAPEELRSKGISDDDWCRITEFKDQAFAGHPFHKNPDMEGIYFCFPLACLQMLLCFTLCLPLTMSLYKPYKESNKQAVEDIRSADCSPTIFEAIILNELSNAVRIA